MVANTADDLWVHGLKVCPDLDTVMYTLGDGIDPERGWGRTEETWHAKEELAAYGVEPTWFGLGDRDLATHLVRTQMLEAGYPLSAVTAALCRRWQPGSRLLPMTDDRVETHVVIDDAETGERRAVHFQEYWIRHQAAVPAYAVVPIGLEESDPGARRARGAHRDRPGAGAAVQPGRLGRHDPRRPRHPRRAASPPPRRWSASPPSSAPTTCAGWPASCSASSASRSPPPAWPSTTAPAPSGGVLDGWLVDSTSTPARSRGSRRSGLRCRAVPLMMTDHDATADIVAAAVDLVSVTVPRLEAWSVDGIGEVRRRHRPRRACWPTSTSATATSCWSPARWSARPRAGSQPATARRRSTRRPCAWSPGAGRPGSWRTATGW